MTDRQLIGLTNGIAFGPAGPLAGGSIDYFHYRVSPNAVQVNFEILQPDGNVDLYLERGFCPSNLVDIC